MKKCIFCGKTESEFDATNSWSEEHIIPKALGNNTLFLYNVCKKCNSKLGENVDDYVTNNFIIQIIRQFFGLKGQKGKIPNAFYNGKDDEGHLISLDKDFCMSIKPVIEEEENTIRIITNSKDETKKIFSIKAGRLNLNEDQIQACLEEINRSEEKQIVVEVGYDFSIDRNRFYLEALKIAYEFAIYKLGEIYMTDKRAEEIRKFLKRAIDGEIKESCPSFQGVFPISDEFFEKYLKKFCNDNSHLLILISDSDNSLWAYILLFKNPLFSFVVKLSDSSDLYLNTRQTIWESVEVVFDNN